MENIEILGLLAGFASTVSFIPQVIKVWRTGRTNGISKGMYVIYFLSLILWSIYAWFINSYPLLIAEVVTAFMVLYILVKMFKGAETSKIH